MLINKGPPRSARRDTSWEPVATWYEGWAGPHGSHHHRTLAIPAVLDLLDLQPGERVLDLGAGPGSLAPAVHAAGSAYTGVDLSRSLIRAARQAHGSLGRFLLGDARDLARVEPRWAGSFDAAVFMLSIQDMDPLEAVLRSAAWSLRPGGRLVLLMTHPCFRVPRQSGWGWDAQRKLRYRRVDRYLTPLAVPMKAYGRAKQETTRSFHRPLEAYVNGLAAAGLVIDRLREYPGPATPPRGATLNGDEASNPDIPLFLGLRGRKPGGRDV